MKKASRVPAAEQALDRQHLDHRARSRSRRRTWSRPAPRLASSQVASAYGEAGGAGGVGQEDAGLDHLLPRCSSEPSTVPVESVALTATRIGSGTGSLIIERSARCHANRRRLDAAAVPRAVARELPAIAASRIRPMPAQIGTPPSSPSPSSEACGGLRLRRLGRRLGLHRRRHGRRRAAVSSRSARAHWCPPDRASARSRRCRRPGGP